MKTRRAKSTRPTLRTRQRENARLRRTLAKLSKRDMQPDEAYNLTAKQLTSQRKEFTQLIAKLRSS